EGAGPGRGAAALGAEGDRLPLGRLGQCHAATLRSAAATPVARRRRGAIPDAFAIEAESQHAPGRSQDTARVAARVRSHSLDADVAEPAVVAVPPLDAIAEREQVDLHARARLMEKIVQRDAVGAIGLFPHHA